MLSWAACLCCSHIPHIPHPAGWASREQTGLPEAVAGFPRRMKPFYPPWAGLSWWLPRGAREVAQGLAWGCLLGEGTLDGARQSDLRGPTPPHPPGPGALSAGSDAGTTQPPASARASPLPCDSAGSLELSGVRQESGSAGSPPSRTSELQQGRDSEHHPSFLSTVAPGTMADADLALTSCPPQAPAG